MCSHANVIDDVITATEVCTDCGLVMDNQLIGDCGNNIATNYSSDSNDWSVEFYLTNEVLEILAVIHQDYSIFAHQVVHYLKKHHWQSPLLRNNYATQRGLLAFAIWEVLNRNDCPRSPQDIAHLCGVSDSHMQRTERELGVSPTFCRPSLYVDRLCGELHLPRVAWGIVSKAVECVDHFMHRPESICAGVILEMQYQLRKEWSMCFPDIDIKRVCQTFGIASEVTVKNMRARLPIECKNVIASCLVSVNPHYLVRC